MGWLVPLACALAALAATELAARLALRRRTGAGALAAGGVRWLALSSLLVGIFAVQESAELLLVHGRLDVAESLVVHGGWIALPLCFAVGALVALLLRGARALLARAWGRSAPLRPSPGGACLAPSGRASRSSPATWRDAGPLPS
jgi:hypothetical protein